MHCASAIPVIIPRPGVDTMADRRMGGMTALVALPCVGVQPRAASRHGFGDERTARLPVRVGAPPEALRTRVACHHADEGGPSMGRRAVACACRGASTWRVAGSGRGRALFPRRAGTARRPKAVPVITPVGTVACRWACTRCRNVCSCVPDSPYSRAPRAVGSPFAMPRRRSPNVAGRWRVFSTTVWVSSGEWPSHARQWSAGKAPCGRKSRRSGR